MLGTPARKALAVEPMPATQTLGRAVSFPPRPTLDSPAASGDFIELALGPTILNLLP
jgi:hypothetical protein